MDYKAHFEILEHLEQDPDIVFSPDLWQDDPEKTFAWIMESLAQKGFTSKDPTTGHSILASVFSWYINRLGYELNLKPSWEWYQLLRLFGLQQRPAAYPRIELEFTRNPNFIRENGFLNTGTEVKADPKHRQYQEVSAYTAEDLYFFPGEITKKVPARLNKAEKMESLPPDVFTKIPRTFGQIQSVRNTRILSSGRDSETIPDLIKRGRNEIRRGDLLISPEDYRNEALDAGALQVSVLPQRYGIVGNIANTLKVSVYPPTVVPVVKNRLTDETRIPASQIVNVESAELIPITGEIEVRFVQGVSQEEKFNLVAKTIRDKINPPNAIWGDKQIKTRLASELEKVDGIYAVPSLSIWHARNNTPIEELVDRVTPWQLFIVQKSLRVL